MELETIRDILFCIMGLTMALGFRHVGRSVLEERKKMNQIIGLRFKFNGFDVKVAQLLALFFGIVIFLLGAGSLIGLIHIS